MKWVFYVIVFIYMCYRAVYGAKIKTINSLFVEPIDYGKYESYLPPGAVKTIACRYTNTNQQVEWIDPSGKTVSYSKKNRIFAQKYLKQTPQGDRIPSVHLVITDAWVEDSGEYECRSSGDLSEKISLCIIDPLTFVDTPTEVSVDEGRSFTLTCEARGRPEPRLVWYRNEEIIADDCNSTKYKVMTKFNSQGFQGQLTITSIEPDDAGQYTCEAIQEHRGLDDCGVRKNWNVTLHVNHAPVFEDGNVTVLFAKYNDTVDLECDPKAYPAPTFRWFSELNKDTLLNYPPEKVISEDDTKTRINIVANALTFGMNYVCQATNNLGSASKTFVVLKLEKPKQPSEVYVGNVTESQVDLNVTWFNEIFFPVTEIEVQYLKEGAKRRLPKEYEWRKADIKTFEFEDGIEEEDLTVTLSDLEPETNYWIRLQAGNELGLSPWSNPILASTLSVEEVTEEVVEAEDLEISLVRNVEKDEARTDSMFYGIFFGGGIVVVAFLCMLALKLV